MLQYVLIILVFHHSATADLPLCPEHFDGLCEGNKFEFAFLEAAIRVFKHMSFRFMNFNAYFKSSPFHSFSYAPGSFAVLPVKILFEMNPCDKSMKDAGREKCRN